MDFEAKQARKLASAKTNKQLLYRPNSHSVVHLPEGRCVIENADVRFRAPPDDHSLKPGVLAPVLYEMDEVGRAEKLVASPSFVSSSNFSFAHEEARARQLRHSPDRPSLLQVFHVEAAEFAHIDGRIRLPPSPEPPGLRLLVRPRQVAFQHAPPASVRHVATLSLWNLASGEKLSEDFCCNFDGNDVSGLFSVPLREPSVVVLAVILRSMVDESMEQVLDTYLKPIAKKTSIGGSESRFLSPLCVAVLPLFRADGTLLPMVALEGGSPLIAFPKGGLDCQRLAPLVGTSSSGMLEAIRASKHLRIVPGGFLAEIAEVPDVNRLQDRVGSGAAGTGAIHDIHTFSSPIHAFPQYDESLNLLFVRPISLSLSKMSLKGRSLLVQVFLKDEDSDPGRPTGLPLFFSRVGSPGLQDGDATSVVFNEKNRIFFEEFKIRLPSVLSPSLHLLFLISHVEASGASKRVGFSFLPLVVGSSHALLQDGSHSLSVSSSFPSAYLTEPDQLRVIDKRPSFVVETRVHSTLHFGDPHLRAYLRSALQPGVSEASLSNQLAPCPTHILVVALPRLLDALFALVATNGQASVVRTAIDEILELVQRVVDMLSPSHARVAILDSYVGYVFRLHVNATARSLVNLVNATSAAVKDRAMHLVASRFVWFLLDVIIKQMFCLADREGTLAVDDRRKRFSPELHTALEGLVRALVAEIVVLSEE